MNAQDVLGYELRVGFYPTALYYNEIGNANYLPARVFSLRPSVSANTVYLAATSVTSTAVASEGTLATFTFELEQLETINLRLRLGMEIIDNRPRNR